MNEQDKMIGGVQILVGELSCPTLCYDSAKSHSHVYSRLKNMNLLQFQWAG